ncbi:hypothetical protein D3C76_1726260 [compost metagenome]
MSSSSELWLVDQADGGGHTCGGPNTGMARVPLSSTTTRLPPGGRSTTSVRCPREVETTNLPRPSINAARFSLGSVVVFSQ